jgi:hypothetical protein
MNPVELPALRGDRVLGFLAALGVLRLLAEDLGDAEATLAWPSGGRGYTVVHSASCSDVGELAEALFEVVMRAREANQLLPGVDMLPLRAAKVDPMNGLSFADGRGLSTSVQSELVAEGWLASLVGVSAPPLDKTSTTLGRSRWWAVGPGPVTIAGTLAKAMEPISTVEHMRSALVSWRRHDWVGGYLDASADIGKERTAGSRPKDDVKSAVVGATWLALMATRWFPERAVSEHRTETVGWSVRSRAAHFCYPVWFAPLSAPAVMALLDHPVVASADRSLHALGVSELWQATRLRSGNNNAAVTHSVLVWPERDP